MFKKLFSRVIAISTLSISACVFAQTAQTKPTLTVYTYDSFASEWGPGPAIKKAFEAECRCELKLVALEDGVSLLNRLRMEGKKTSADIVLGLDNNLIQAAQQTGLFTPSHLDTSKLKLPVAWNNTTFIPYDYGYFAFIYNKNTLPHPPRNMDELINGNQNWKIIYQDPRTSTPGLGLLLWMQKLYGDKAAQEWQKAAKKTLTVTKGWSEAYGLFLKGEGDMVLSYTTSPGYHIMSEKKDNYAAAVFQEGHYLQIEVAAQLASSKQPELAQKFMNFMISPAFQQVIPTTQWMYPVIDMPLPDVFRQLPIPEKSLQFNADDVAKHRTKWIRTWQNAVSR
ncbi:thiamin transport protein (ABC superfamily, peri_bind) [Xenorhabdus nematophila ATCC 19061]|uniref:Thiamin transport protein (ABC superfamily, peri_bind) n=1 Tax=Xenorhabdus nematophila (strain ATCC 19061 / DSM 3370 / CCUG 14189 / LMG 1036 / NCIMB 9965 / AN6) TaxID=406817 RepID=D3VCP3_XENNA|nr:thiamine ABC transporter substrate binding subunit [Xenorhabdus nematophila]CBJ92078.1 thiamin transport protein (ABC superfamily, peri_bind) [Xenorhabdus nematophila ATCC 19061]CEK24892.1 thiamin transport protein (ABC superfamily, peri_bind) [Xenorhabdus nematophila AN6/1]